MRAVDIIEKKRNGNKLTEEEQWNKLKLVKEVAEEVWGK